MPDTSSVYRPRKPQNFQYYQCVEDNFETFEQVYEDPFERQYGFLYPAQRICKSEMRGMWDVAGTLFLNGIIGGLQSFAIPRNWQHALRPKWEHMTASHSSASKVFSLLPSLDL